MPPTASDRNDEERKRAKSHFMEEIATIRWVDVPEHLSKAPSWMKADRNFMIEVVKQNGYAVKHASDELRADQAIVMAAVKQHGWALRYASNKLKNDRDIVMAAVKKYGYPLRHASDELKADRDIVMAAVKQNGPALHWASNEMKANRDIVMEAVKQNGRALQYASAEMKANQDIVMEAVKQDEDALDHVPKDVTLRLLKKVAEAGKVKKQNKSLKKSVETQAKQIKEFKVALASSRPVDSVDLLQEENEGDLKPSKRARIDEKSDRPKSSLAMISEMSTKMAKIKEEASDSIRIAEKKKDEAEFALGECPICFEIREEAIALIPCGHVMCSECANKCVAEDCPTCHTRVESHLRLHK